jgi:hypothetical protein
MILDEKIKIKWNNFTKQYYINKGYVFTNIGEYFTIKIEDLPKKSHTKIKVKCENCGHEKLLSYREYLNCLKIYNIYFCKKCSHIKEEKTCLEKYGYKKPLQNENIKNRQTQTIIDRYGVENPFQSEKIKEKIKKTNLEKYGNEYANQSEEVKEKIKQTNLERYGVENTFQSEEIKEKIKNTFIKKYGVKNPTLNPIILEKSIQTQIEKYGEAFFHYCPKHNPLSIIELDKISKDFNINIQHALNGGEKKFQRYWVDGFIQEYNIVIEWDEKRHNKQKEKDIKRQNWIEENFGCKFIRINDKDWFDNNSNERDRVYKLLESYVS